MRLAKAKKPVWTEEELLKVLPHGSGIDADWEISNISPRNKYIKCKNSYHLMDEWGWYDGWYDFTVWVPVRKTLGEFRTWFHISFPRWPKNADIAKDYISEAVYYNLVDHLEHISKQLELFGDGC